MSKKLIFGLVGLVMAVGIGVWSMTRLNETEKKLERTIQPVEVSAPDLYPADTLVLLAAHRLDESWDEIESLMKKLEPTATWHIVKRLWEERRQSMPPEIRDFADHFENEMERAEEKYGARPTTKEFFSVYGKFTTFGLLPANKKGEAPGTLIVIKLPGKTAGISLESSFSGARDVKRSDPVRGYPVFVETRGDQKFNYGIGGGYFFITDRLRNMKRVLKRLDTLRGGIDNKSSSSSRKNSRNRTKKKRTRRKKKKRNRKRGRATGKYLSSNPVLKRVTKGGWEDMRIVFYLRRDLFLGDWIEDLEYVDDYVHNTFLLAPKDQAVAFSFTKDGENDSYEMRSSFPFEGKREWGELLPAGLSQLELPGKVDQATLQKANAPLIDALADKAIWKEFLALLDDPDRIRTLLKEAVPGDIGLTDESLERLDADGKLIANAWRKCSERLLFTPPISSVMATKLYKTKEYAHLEGVMAFEVDAMTVFGLAGMLQLAKALTDGEVVQEEYQDYLVWRMDLDSLEETVREEMGQEGDVFSSNFLIYEPAVILGRGKIFLVAGKNLRREILALATGKSKDSILTDSVFIESRDALEDGWLHASFTRPNDLVAGRLGGYRAQMEMVSKLNRYGGVGLELPLETQDLFTASFGVMDTVIEWGRQTRGQMTAYYPNRKEPSKTVTLLDRKKRAKYPALDLPQAKSKALATLPDRTFFLFSTQIQMRPVWDGLVEAFKNSLPAGSNLVEELESKTGDEKEWVENILHQVFRDVQGEVGVAITVAEKRLPTGRPMTAQDAISSAPGIVLFAEHKDPDAAFTRIREVLERICNESEETPFSQRYQDYLRGYGPEPVGLQYAHQVIGEQEFAEIDILIPQGRSGELATFSIGFVLNNGVIYATNSLTDMRALLEVPGGSFTTLKERLEKDLPASALPDTIQTLSLFRSDGVLESIRRYVDPNVPALSVMTLSGYRERPPEDRIRAHQKGWERLLFLVEDLFSSQRWSMSWAVESEGRVETVCKSLPIQKD